MEAGRFAVGMMQTDDSFTQGVIPNVRRFSAGGGISRVAQPMWQHCTPDPFAFPSGQALRFALKAAAAQYYVVILSGADSRFVRIRVVEGSL